MKKIIHDIFGGGFSGGGGGGGGVGHVFFEGISYLGSNKYNNNISALYSVKKNTLKLVANDRLTDRQTDRHDGI